MSFLFLKKSLKFLSIRSTTYVLIFLPLYFQTLQYWIHDNHRHHQSLEQSKFFFGYFSPITFWYYFKVIISFFFSCFNLRVPYQFCNCSIYFWFFPFLFYHGFLCQQEFWTLDNYLSFVIRRAAWGGHNHMKITPLMTRGGKSLL